MRGVPREGSSSTLSKLLKSEKILLHDFKIDFTPEIVQEISDRYPNMISVDRYIHTLIVERLNT